MAIEPGYAVTHYRLVEKLGEGGMGVVWKALDTNLEREVAIKVLPSAFSADQGRMARFAREAKLLASINHPNIATVYGLHEQDGTLFLAMELIPGEDLATSLARRSLTIVEALSIARQIAAALEATHERGVVHRDLKPANVYLTPGGGVKVLDFGIARDMDPASMGESSDEGPAKTEPGTILGTVSYMSPEQARGRGLDARTDIWSFGCVLYEMLCGRAVFRGETRWDKLAAVLREEPDWNVLPAGLPESIRSLLRRCLQKEPAQRLATAVEARGIVEGALAAMTLPEGTPAVGESTGGGRVAGSGRRAALLSVLALVACAAVAGLWALRDRQDGVTAAADARSLAVLPLTSLGGGDENAAFASGIHDDILNRLHRIKDIKVISRTSVMEYRDTPKNLKQIAGELGVATVLEGSVHRAGDQVRINVQLIDAATEDNLWAESYDRKLTVENIFAIQSDIAAQIAASLQATLSDDELRRIDAPLTADLEAYEAYLRGVELHSRPGLVAANLVGARAMFEEAIRRDPAFAMAHAGLSSAARDHYWMAGGPSDSRELSLAAADRALALAPDLPEAHQAKGSILYVLRDYDRALGELNLAEQGLPGNAEVVRWKGYIVRRQGKWDEALQYLKRAQALDPRDPQSAHEVAFTLYCLRRYDEALPYLEVALSLAKDYPSARIHTALIPVMRDGNVEAARRAADQIEATAPGPWSYAHGWQVLMYSRDWDRAVAFADRPERISGQWYQYPPSLLVGWTRWAEGDAAAARAAFEEARTELEASVAADPGDARVHGALAVAYAGLGMKDAAVREGTLAVEGMPIDRDVFVGIWQLQDFGFVQAMIGNPEAAVEAFDRVLSIPSALSIEGLLLDPRVDSLREHSAFKALVAKHRRLR